MRRVPASVARREFAEVLNQVAYGKERVVIGRRGKELAAVVPIGDLRALEALEDRLDAEDALRVEADTTDERVSWQQVKGELGRAVPRRREAQRRPRARKAARPRPRQDRPRSRRAR